MDNDTSVLARTLWGEARGEGLTGMLAVACAIRNRVKHPSVRWWGTGWAGVCKAPWQFSCWNANDPNLPKMLALTEADPLFRRALDVAKAVTAEGFPDITNRADHYCTKAVAGRTAWAKGQTPVATIGAHLFFKLH